MKTTTVYIESTVPKRTVSRIVAHLNREALKNPDWNGTAFVTAIDDHTWIENYIDESAACKLHSQIVDIINGDDA